MATKSGKTKTQNLKLLPSPKKRYTNRFTTLPPGISEGQGQINLSAYESRILAGIELQDFGYPKERKAVSVSWLRHLLELKEGMCIER